MAKPRFTEDDKTRARAIYEERGPTEAAKALGCSKGTVGKWAQAGGWRTVRNETTRAATEARMTDFQASRAEMVEELLAQSRDLIARMNEPHVEFVGKDGRRVEIDRPTAGAVKDYSIAVGVLIDKMRLELGEATSKEEQVRTDKVTAEIERLEQQFNGKSNGRVHA